MIISKKNKTIIFRVPKTGSTSLEAALRFSGCLGDEDIVSAVGDAGLPELNVPTKYSEHLNKKRQIQNSIRDKKRVGDKNFSKEELKELSKKEENVKSEGFADIGLLHGTLDDLANPNELGRFDFLTKKELYEYESYAFIRNPLSRAISCYFFSKGYATPPHIEEFHQIFLKAQPKGLVFRPQIEYFKLDGELIVSPLLFENYQKEMNYLIQKMGGSPLGEYPRFKEGLATKNFGATIEDWINPYPEVKQAILNRYSEDAELWQKTSEQTL